ncbi:uncharacterized protein CEXT_814341 [Caerostris extrusa]|uniref:Uncharacterized protein n=1 Tax=Caerostris extrusa TaxID=172846 RepID=A0AAV4QX80_CAEEX|nr:uncharacterized protein CEXT_814341 [Caerostris extrusa]
MLLLLRLEFQFVNLPQHQQRFEEISVSSHILRCRSLEILSTKTTQLNKNKSTVYPAFSDSFNTFIYTFKAVYSSQPLSRLFDFDNTPATEFSEKIYQVILEALKTLGADDQIYAATKADILTPYNSIQFALAYVREMERASMCYQSQYEALSAGFVNFLTSLGLFTVDSALMVCLEYGNEWKLAAQACQ